MATSHIGRLLRQRVEEERQTSMDSLARGEAKDFETYRYLIGRLTGMKQVMQFLDEIERE